MTNLDRNKLLHPDILEKIKRHLEKIGVKIYTIDVEKGSVKGDNYLGVIARIDVAGTTGEGKETLLHFIAKSAPTQESFRKITSIDLCFGREIYMYQTVFPEFIKLQESKKLSKPYKNFAPVYITCLEEGKECLVMENMKEKGYRLKDRFRPLELDHVLLVVREYGRYHALSFALKEQRPDVFKKLAASTREQFFHNFTHDMMQRSLEMNFDRVIEALDGVKHAQVVKKLQEIKPNAFKKVVEVLEPDAAGEFSVIGHGDSWVNNILFKYGDDAKPDKPTDLIFLDWQLAKIGSPCLDLTYFLFTCTDKALRDEHFEAILQEYYGSFSSFLKELGCNPQRHFPKEVMEEHMKRFSIYGFVMSIMVIFMMVTDSEDIPDWQEMDIEEMENSMNFKSKNEDKFKDRVQGVALDYFDKGYF